MDTKFKNKDLLITVLDRCIECKYHISVMLHIKYMINYHNTTFEQALKACMLSCLRDKVYRTISKMYHRYIKIFNMNKLNMKKGIDNNE